MYVLKTIVAYESIDGLTNNNVSMVLWWLYLFLLKACVDEFSEVVFKRLENRHFCWLFCAYLLPGAEGRVIWKGKKLCLYILYNVFLFSEGFGAAASSQLAAWHGPCVHLANGWWRRHLNKWCAQFEDVCEWGLNIFFLLLWRGDGS